MDLAGLSVKLDVSVKWPGFELCKGFLPQPTILNYGASLSKLVTDDMRDIHNIGVAYCIPEAIRQRKIEQARSALRVVNGGLR